MPPSLTPDDPEQTSEQPLSPAPTPEQKPDPNAPLSVVPHAPPSTTPYRIRVNRYGEMEEHELIKLLDSIEDQVARARFRESIYISFFTCCVLALLLLFGPKYIWHTPQLISPADAIRHQEIIALNAPRMRPSPVSRPAPRALDNNTLKQLREMTKETPRPAPTAPTPAPPMPSNPSNLPSAPQPTNVPPPQPTVARVNNPAIPEAPAPSHNPQPNFNTPSNSLSEITRQSAKDRSSGGAGPGMTGTSKGAVAGLGGLQVLSDTQGVDFSDYLKRIYISTYRAWLPLLPEEVEPPISKEGETYIIFTILPDGRLAPPPAMKLEASSHDVALDKAAWASLVSQGGFPPLPSQFHGPGLTLRFHYMVNKGIGH